MSATDNSDDRLDQELEPTVDRRAFMRSALATAALATVPSGLTAQDTTGRGGGRGQAAAPPPKPLGQGDPPAMVFQPYPGGTGAYLERIARERGRNAFERERFTVDGWRGAVPTSEDDIAYLPAHRLAALMQAKKITSVQLT